MQNVQWITIYNDPIVLSLGSGDKYKHPSSALRFIIMLPQLLDGTIETQESYWRLCVFSTHSVTFQQSTLGHVSPPFDTEVSNIYQI